MLFESIWEREQIKKSWYKQMTEPNYGESDKFSCATHKRIESEISADYLVLTWESGRSINGWHCHLQNFSEQKYFLFAERKPLNSTLCSW